MKAWAEMIWADPATGEIVLTPVVAPRRARRRRKRRGTAAAWAAGAAAWVIGHGSLVGTGRVGA